MSLDALTESQKTFLADHGSAAMITVGKDGRPKAARVGVALLDGKLWSSGTADRMRTRRLRNDPRCTLYFFDPGYAWLALETQVRLLDGPDAPQLNERLFRVMQDKPTGNLSWFGGELGPVEFIERMVQEQRLIYEFEIERAYGMA